MRLPREDGIVCFLLKMKTAGCLSHLTGKMPVPLGLLRGIMIRRATGRRGQLSVRRNHPWLLMPMASRIDTSPVMSFTSCVADPLAAHRTPLQEVFLL